MSAYELALDEAVASGVVVATLSGELDLTNASELEEQLDHAAPAGSLLVVDVNRVVFIDSAALHVLFKVAQRRSDGGLAIAMGPDAPISRALEIVGLNKAARVVRSLEELDLSPAT